jgi:hypothetical protein
VHSSEVRAVSAQASITHEEARALGHYVPTRITRKYGLQNGLQKSLELLKREVDFATAEQASFRVAIAVDSAQLTEVEARCVEARAEAAEADLFAKKHGAFVKKNTWNAGFFLSKEEVAERTWKKRNLVKNLETSRDIIQDSLRAAKFAASETHSSIYGEDDLNGISNLALFALNSACDVAPGGAEECSTLGCSGFGILLMCSAGKSHTRCHDCWESNGGCDFGKSACLGAPPCTSCANAFFDVSDVIRAAPWVVATKVGMAAAVREKALSREAMAVPECSVCKVSYDDVTKPVAAQCGHVFCGGCAGKWAQRSVEAGCPRCRHVPFGPFTALIL